MESREEIMEATNSALRKQSYSELSIQNIADEFKKSKSLLYHHYDSKDEIMLDFLDYTLEQFREEALLEKDKEFRQEFEDKAFMAFDICEDCDFLKTLIELRVQALRDQRYRQRFSRFEALYRQKIAELLERGQEKGEFQAEFSSEDVAGFICHVNNEALHRRAEGRDTEKPRKELKEYIISRLYREE